MLICFPTVYLHLYAPPSSHPPLVSAEIITPEYSTLVDQDARDLNDFTFVSLREFSRAFLSFLLSLGRPKMASDLECFPFVWKNRFFR